MRFTLKETTDTGGFLNRKKWQLYVLQILQSGYFNPSVALNCLSVMAKCECDLPNGNSYFCY